MQRVEKRRKEEGVEQPPDNRIEWINRGGPFYTRDRTRIIKGQKYMATPEEIPEAFRDTQKPVDPVTASIALKPKEIEQARPSFRIEQRGNTKFYDIINEKGKRMNERNLHREDALDLLSQLMSAGE